MGRRLPVILATMLALAGCAESNAEVNAPDEWDAIEADPALARGAELALEDAPPPADGWRIGVVLAEDEDEWAMTALTDGGVAYLDNHTGSGACKWHPPERYALLVDPGDLVTWSMAGDDSHLCIDEIEVLRKAAAAAALEQEGGGDE